MPMENKVAAIQLPGADPKVADPKSPNVAKTANDPIKTDLKSRINVISASISAIHEHY